MLVKQTVGLVLIAVNIWSSVSVFEVLGEFGWFYGDFFISTDAYRNHLCYTGIYRFLNNPDCVTGYAGYYGLALMARSWTLFGVYPSTVSP
jgi:phosphatidylethanolamine N-methyltransferase